MTTKTSNLMSEYVVLENEFKILERRREDLRKELMEKFLDEHIDKVEDPILGSFTLAYRSLWTYSKAVKKIEERLKIAKVKEQQKGTAKATEISYLVYNEPKEKII